MPARAALTKLKFASAVLVTNLTRELIMMTLPFLSDPQTHTNYTTNYMCTRHNRQKTSQIDFRNGSLSVVKSKRRKHEKNTKKKNARKKSGNKEITRTTEERWSVLLCNNHRCAAANTKDEHNGPGFGILDANPLSLISSPTTAVSVHRSLVSSTVYCFRILRQRYDHFSRLKFAGACHMSTFDLTRSKSTGRILCQILEFVYTCGTAVVKSGALYCCTPFTYGVSERIPVLLYCSRNNVRGFTGMGRGGFSSS